MKIPAKYIASHLPYVTKFYNENDGNVFTLTNPWRSTLNHFDDGGGPFIELGEYTPILRPITDLKAEISHNGEKLTPIVELGKICGMKIEHLDDDQDGIPMFGQEFFFDIETENPGDEELVFERSSGFFVKIWDEGRERLLGERFLEINQLLLFQKLFEWQFDVWGIIGTYAYDWNKVFGN